jgi:hypothetical protein
MICIYIYIYTHTHIHTHTHAYTYAYTHTHTHTYHTCVMFYIQRSHDDALGSSTSFWSFRTNGAESSNGTAFFTRRLRSRSLSRSLSICHEFASSAIFLPSARPCGASAWPSAATISTEKNQEKDHQHQYSLTMDMCFF